jgi:bifunctional non-homologous end joining protein LigD
LWSPSGADWVHEIKHDGYRPIVRGDGPTIRHAQLDSALAADRDCCADDQAKSFTIDGEAVVLGPDGLSLFDELRGREAADTAILYAVDLIEHDGEDLRNRLFVDREAARL